MLTVWKSAPVREAWREGEGEGEGEEEAEDGCSCTVYGSDKRGPPRQTYVTAALLLPEEGGESEVRRFLK